MIGFIQSGGDEKTASAVMRELPARNCYFPQTKNMVRK
jgi:hypothetical protein